MLPTRSNSSSSETARDPSSVSLRSFLMCDTAIIVIGITLGGLFAGPAYAANLVTNGGFETENLDGFGNPVSPPPGWTITGDGISIDSTFSFTGTYDIAFGATASDPSPGKLSQAITTTPGQAYNLSFALFDEVGQSTDTFTVTLGGFSQTITGNQATSYTTETFVVPGADITGMANAGIPAFGLLQDGRTYFHYHHTAADTLDKVVPGELRENAATMAVMGYALASMKDPLPR